MGNKICIDCGITGGFKLFLSVGNRCLECKKIYDEEWKKKHIKDIAAINKTYGVNPFKTKYNKDKAKKWRDENKEANKAKRKIYLAKNKEKVRAQQKEYREKNKEKLKEYHKEYNKKYYQANKNKRK